MKRKKYRLRPWVKVTMLFVLGVIVTAKIFSYIGAMASTEDAENKIYHGIIRLNLNGESELFILEDDYDYTREISIRQKKYYEQGTVVTVVMEGERVVKDYITTGKELDKVEKKYKMTLIDIRRNIMETLNE
ncbi:hypothetical protein [Viridibacillus arvi]|uniref:hypothetical protein n=1 Tax=Viridibacillus arvi TaxID=263475 RepID=UPI0034CEF246